MSTSHLYYSTIIRFLFLSEDYNQDSEDIIR
jgi:hypothetical protein